MKKIMAVLTMFFLGTVVHGGDWSQNPFAKESDPFRAYPTDYRSINAGSVHGGLAASREGLGLPSDFIIGGAEGRRLARERRERLERVGSTAAFVAEQVRAQRGTMGDLAARTLEHQSKVEDTEQQVDELEKDTRKLQGAQAKLLRAQKEGYAGEAKEFASDCSKCTKHMTDCCWKWCCWCDCREFSDK